jgi:hypothetical protein
MNKSQTNRLKRLESKIMSEEVPGYSKKEIEVLRAWACGRLDHSAISERLMNKTAETLTAKVLEAFADPNFDETGIYLWLAQRPDLEPYLRDCPEWEPFVRANCPEWEPSTSKS